MALQDRRGNRRLPRRGRRHGLLRQHGSAFLRRALKRRRDKDTGHQLMHKLTRRRLLKLAALTAGVAVAGGGCAPAAVPPTPASPASAQPPPGTPTSKAQTEPAALYIAYCGLDCTPCAKYRGKPARAAWATPACNTAPTARSERAAASSGSPTAPTAKSIHHARSWRLVCRLAIERVWIGGKPAQAVLDKVQQASSKRNRRDEPSSFH